jgi:hypothetical protein
MDTTVQIHHRQRLAWVVLLGSFLACMAVTIMLPVSAISYVQNATRDLTITIQANQGTVGIDDETGVRRAIIAGEPVQTVVPGASILTDAQATAILFVSPPETDELMARFKIDSNTSMQFHSATSPRFGLSNAVQAVDLELQSGRLRLSLLESASRPVYMNLITPHGEVFINEPGEYSVEVDNSATQVSVQVGTAVTQANGENLTLNRGERAEIASGSSPVGPLAPERNLIQNGDFSAGFQDWAEYAWLIELTDEPKGKTEITTIDGEPALRFSRNGVGHADASVRQSLNHNVNDYRSLRLLLSLRVIEQSLGVCGVQGSECPLFIRIEYIDQNGANQIWQQGFYALGEIDDNNTPGACISCAVLQSNHDRVPLDQEFFYEVDLREELARQGAVPPSRIESISLVTSGHSFITDVIDFSLIANE